MGEEEARGGFGGAQEVVAGWGPGEVELRAEMTKNIIWMALPTPARAAGPSRATMMVSTIPSIVCRKFSPMTGHARLKTRRCNEIGTAGWLADNCSESTRMGVVVSIYPISFSLLAKR